MFVTFKQLQLFRNLLLAISLESIAIGQQFPAIAEPAFSIAQSVPNISVCDLVNKPALVEKFSQPQTQKNLNKEKNAETNSPESGLWWVKEQLDKLEENLLLSWQADSQNQSLDLIVDRQRWSRLNYLERYRFVHQFGSVARENHYSLRIFNQQQKCLVAYWCNFQFTPYQCEMKFASPVESRFQIYTPAPGEFSFDKKL